ncbi:hypothetical protein [Neptunomonas marina]|uniref:Uncharacterized protein n=1 Tax=Neptunomonas marina TaxID=1815562 RepID=A0A437QE96_9GAMM|nr:hypothetical protein [Neptunomonas marina]RVU32713.1 hypothetical protein EOE65_03395 [Neptunomonas marina]
MSSIDKQSRTWAEVVKFSEERRAVAIADLISGVNSEQQRGAIKFIDELLELAESKTPVATKPQEYL